METTTVRITDKTRKTLRRLACETGDSMQDVVRKAVDAYERKLFFERFNAAYAELRADPQAWQEELDERAAWDTTLMDGLGDK